MPPSPLPLYILCGGYSKRFGSDKARALHQNKPLILHVANKLDQGASITAVADQPDKYADLGLQTIADKQTHLGPMGGLSAALAHCQSDYFLLVACDQLMIKPTWIDTLTQHLATHPASEPQPNAITFRDKFYDPMPGLYHTSISPHVDECLRTENRSLQTLLKTANTLTLPLPTDWINPPSINTPQDLQALTL